VNSEQVLKQPMADSRRLSTFSGTLLFLSGRGMVFFESALNLIAYTFAYRIHFVFTLVMNINLLGQYPLADISHQRHVIMARWFLWDGSCESSRAS
jgi:hypothetical protein